MIRYLMLPIAALALSAEIAPPARSGPVLEVATSAQLAPTLRALAAAYERARPGRRVAILAVGSDVAMARFSTGRSELAIIGRRGHDQELKAYEWIHRKLPVATPVFRGSVATPGHSPALAVRVHVDNSLRAITREQLTVAFRAYGDPPRWTELGAGGPLAQRPVVVVMPWSDGGTGRYLRASLLAGRVQLDWRRVRERTDVRAPDLGRDSFGAEIAAAVARDPAALGLGDATKYPGTRVLPVVVDGQPRLPGQPGYPFEREVVAYADPVPRPIAADFAVFISSAAARAIIARGPYRPLD
ncbi:MAG: hypothetical protein JWN21_342 [Sphingomonas bacterium]|uniref:substrate-binding domain-containing protein n=1 Tax=Sphingomonas bacterium TaxID=1895847 RepID=UPI002628B7D7|nr:substrate-binding domain-containing protein [Sphingomonas bacterium]MDB5694799.1 hypothetical protein [Sphingomonas bacterium]